MKKFLKYKKTKYSWFPQLNQLYKVYKKLLKEDQSFDWSFFKLIYKTKIEKSYKLHKVNSLEFILLCKINKIEKIVEIEYSYISTNTLSDPALCQALNIQLNEYKLEYGYTKVFIEYEYEKYSKEIREIFTGFLDFKIDINKDLLASIKNAKFNNIILLKTIL